MRGIIRGLKGILSAAVIIALGQLLLQHWQPKPQPIIAQKPPSFEEIMRMERYGYPTEAEALQVAHRKFDDFEGRYALVREAEPDTEPGSYLRQYRLWDEGTWDGKNMVTPFAEEWFFWDGENDKSLVKGDRVYVIVSDRPRKGENPKRLQAYVRFLTRKEKWGK